VVIDFLKKVLKSFDCAGDGIALGFNERNMRVHGSIALVVIILGIWFGLAAWEWIIILILFGMVFGAELLNTSIENLADVIRDKEGLDYKATKETRDLAAGAVLVTSIVAATIGMLIFGSKLI